MCRPVLTNYIVDSAGAAMVTSCASLVCQVWPIDDNAPQRTRVAMVTGCESQCETPTLAGAHAWSDKPQW